MFPGTCPESEREHDKKNKVVEVKILVWEIRGISLKVDFTLYFVLERMEIGTEGS